VLVLVQQPSEQPSLLQMKKNKLYKENNYSMLNSAELVVILVLRVNEPATVLRLERQQQQLLQSNN
jgi:hypothetical protein